MFPSIGSQTQGDGDVFQRGDDDQRPQDQRQRAEDCRWFWMRPAGDVEHGLQAVERTGADVAKHHAKGGQAQCCRAEVDWSRLKLRCLDRLVRHGVPPTLLILSQTYPSAKTKSTKRRSTSFAERRIVMARKQNTA